MWPTELKNELNQYPKRFEGLQHRFLLGTPMFSTYRWQYQLPTDRLPQAQCQPQKIDCEPWPSTGGRYRIKKRPDRHSHYSRYRVWLGYSRQNLPAEQGMPCLRQSFHL